jgi:hypothetical protein
MAMLDRNYFNSVYFALDSTPTLLHTAGVKYTSTILKIFVSNTDSVQRTFTLWLVASGGDAPVAVDSRTFKNQVPLAGGKSTEVIGPIILEPGMMLYGGADAINKIAGTGTGYDTSR